MIFFKKKTISYKGYSIPENEAYRISLTWKFFFMLLMLLSGILLSTAFPPFNCSIFAFIALAPLIVLAIQNPVGKNLFWYGYLWGFGWSFCSFFWLREINWLVPYFVALVIALWGGIYALSVSFFHRWGMRGSDSLTYDFRKLNELEIPWYRGIIFSVICGCFFIMLEFIRIKMFPWNFIGITQYRELWLIQIVKWTGIYGVSFLLAGMNGAIAFAIWMLIGKLKGRKNSYTAIFSGVVFFAFLIAASCVYGFFECRRVENEYEKGKVCRLGTVQGDISQRRVSTQEMAKEALDVYLDMSYELLKMRPEIIIWPETAVPYPYYGGNIISGQYRSGVYQLIRSGKIPLLIGTLDFIINSENDYDMTNSAFLFSKDGFVKAKYSKINRVPFGEFIPFRKYLPEKLVAAVDMGRDLRAGNDASPLEILPGVRAGVAVCYESIFASLARNEVNLGANMLLAINNDAWYPESSEPEQHCANAVFRAVENNIVSLRCGNNGATVLILPSGKIGWSLSGHLLKRERRAGVVEVKITNRLQKTFYTKYGDVFLLLVFICGIAASGYSFCQYFSALNMLRKKEKED